MLQPPLLISLLPSRSIKASDAATVGTRTTSGSGGSALLACRVSQFLCTPFSMTSVTPSLTPIPIPFTAMSGSLPVCPSVRLSQSPIPLTILIDSSGRNRPICSPEVLNYLPVCLDVEKHR